MEHGIDWLVVRGNLVFGLGWLGVSDSEVEGISLEVSAADSTTDSLPATRMPYRDVVLPMLRRRSTPSSLLGFIVYGRAAIDDPANAIRLIVKLKNETRKVLDAPFEDLSNPVSPSLFEKVKRRRNQARKVWALARRLMLSELRERIRAWRSRAAPLDEKDPIQFVAAQCEAASGAGLILIIDHALGGGANRYREDLIAGHLEKGGLVGIVYFNLPTLQYVLEVRGAEFMPARFALQSLETLPQMAERSLIKKAWFNNAVSFPDPLDIPKLLAQMKDSYGLPFSVAVHDYFALCPSQYLLDSSGAYCDLPDAETCRRCLPANNWVLFGQPSALDMEAWRESWGRALKRSDEIRCFSESSARLLGRVFPDLGEHQIQVRPHIVDSFPGPPPSVDVSGPLRIGVVGTITYHKGSGLISELSKRIEARNLDIRMVILGTLDESVNPEIVAVTGTYERDDLPRVIKRSGVNVMFLPSIVPETFSYVTSELMQMELPVVCFDIGAPAERVATYARGQVIPLGSADTILDRLIEFHAALGAGAIQAYSA